MERLERLLAKQRKPITERGSDYLEFDDPLWRSMFAGQNLRAMVMYDHGRFWIGRELGNDSVRYDLSSLHGFVFCLIAALFFFFAGFASADLTRGLLLAMFAFGWLYGMNMLLALIRVPVAIRRAVREK